MQQGVWWARSIHLSDIISDKRMVDRDVVDTEAHSTGCIIRAFWLSIFRLLNVMWCKQGQDTILRNDRGK